MSQTLEAATDVKIRRLIFNSGMPLRLFSVAIGTSAGSALQWWSDQSRRLTTRQLESLSAYLGIAEARLRGPEQELPITLIRQRLLEGPQVLPEVYSRHASSFVRSSAHIVDLLAMTYGRHFVDQRLTEMNIHPLIFDNLDNQINLLFFMDFLNGLKSHGMSENQIESFGCYIFLRIQETALGREFRTARTYEECYAILGRSATLFDRNFDYKFEIDAQHVQISAVPTEAMRFLRENDPAIYQRLFRHKRVMMGWVPTLCQLPPLNMQTPKCVSRGDALTIYRAEFPRRDSKPVRLFRALSSLDS